jgi:sulfatase maturation enzyme AslB (radical SAM superfamily)
LSVRFPFLRFPTMFYIEPTNDCNLSCIMCPRKTSRKTVGYMSFDLFRNVVDQLTEQKIVQLSLHLIGEPLLHPRITEMVRYAKGKGLQHVRFATNATLLNDDVSSDLIESGLDSLTVSMDTSTANYYCPGTRWEEFFADLDKNVRQLITLRNRRGLKSPEVHMQIIHMAQTKRLIDQFVKKWQGITDMVTVQPLLSWAGHTKALRKVRRRLICINHLTQGVVQWNGDTSFCCLYIDSRGDSEGILGNVAHTSLEDIFLGTRRREIIEAQLRGNYEAVPSCMECSDWNDFLDLIQTEKKPSTEVAV